MVIVRSTAASLDNRVGSAPSSPPSSAPSSAAASRPRDPTAAPPAAPPLPAGFSQSGAQVSGAPVARCPSGRRSTRLRNFNWEAIPAEHIRGRQNVWTERGRRRGSFLDLDLQLLEELFGQRPKPPSGIRRGQPGEQVSLLDAKKILNLGIFLKQFKRPVQEIVADIRDGAGALYGAEKLIELTKMLPDTEEVKKLEAFQGNQNQLSEAEVFALLLVQVPSYARRLELLVLKEGFFPRLSSLQSAIQLLTEAALELLRCEELHDVLRLVLKAGNHMNEGGYAGSALGFRIPSLLRLADTKANRPGMHLLHFVALEAERKDPSLLRFPSKLQHVGPASRISEREVLAELRELGQHLRDARGELEDQMGPFLHVAEAELSTAGASQEGLHQATAMLCDFLCEQREAFSLPECCSIFQAFGARFLTAVQENRAREAAAGKQQKKRRSIATCSFADPSVRDVELDLLFLHAAAACTGQHRHSSQAAPPITDSPQARERPLPLSRRHTLAVVSPCPKPLPTPELPAAAAATTTTAAPVQSEAAPHPAKKAGCLGQGLKALLAAPTAPPSLGPVLPEAASGFRFPVLFHRKTFPGGSKSPTSPQASSKDITALVGFFHRLSIGKKLPA